VRLPVPMRLDQKVLPGSLETRKVMQLVVLAQEQEQAVPAAHQIVQWEALPLFQFAVPQATDVLLPATLPIANMVPLECLSQAS
jgi:hypothetical protein